MKQYVSVFVLAICIGAFGCGKKKSDDDTTTTLTDTSTTTDTEITPPDSSSVNLTDQDFTAILKEIIPVGGISLSLLEDSGSPCGGTGPAEGTWECQLAKVFADPDVYPGVGGEGVLEGMMLEDKVFKRATDTCNIELTGYDQNVTGPFFAETRKYACAYDVPTPAMKEAAKTSGMTDFTGKTDAELNEMFSGFHFYMYWGETGEAGAEVKNFIGVLKDTGTKAENGVFRFQQDLANKTFEASKVGPKSRYTITGNWQTHAFEVVMRRYRTETSTPYDWMSLKAKGVSQGAGQYYMYKLKGDSYTWNDTVYGPTEELTICVNAETKKSVAVSHCAEYADALTALEYLTNADLPAINADIPYPGE